MKIFESIQLKNSGAKCLHCACFQNDAALIEETYPGLTAMSSGFASVRGWDGFCNHHQTYLSAEDYCHQFILRNSELNQEESAQL
ncbi:MAG: hypothetical protein ABUL44_00345 [Flavobacterium sp.]